MNPELSRRSDLRKRLPAELADVVGYLRRLSVPGVDPEDLGQDVMERALRYEHTFDPSRELLPWLKGVALRVAMDARKASGRRPRSLEHESSVEPTVELPDAAAEREEVERALAALPATDRELLLAFHRDGRSIAELSLSLNQAEGTVKSRLHRARRRLAEWEADRHA